MRWTIAQVANALGTRPGKGLDPVARLAGISIDSRAIRAGELFVAIHGPRHDVRDESVSVMTRSVNGDEQLSSAYCARINRDSGQPRHGGEAPSRPGIQSASHLCNRPPHKCLKVFDLNQQLRLRLCVTGMRAPPFRKLTLGRPKTARPERPLPTRNLPIRQSALGAKVLARVA